ncbi:porin [Aurantimonas sp. Leaf443]|uniref:porin n=1 Tax=Aurantimonas sp. Leaf443 TaxID=1736378 RepID=UPI000AB64FC4|nr:porin [Aurantimonas sp. Leaf443]
MFGAYLAGSIDSNNDVLVDDTFFDTFGLNPDGETDTAFAIKGGVSLKPIENGELKIEGSYAFDPSVYSTIELFNNPGDTTFRFGGTDFVVNTGGALPVEWQAGAGYAQTFGKLGVAVAGVYGETFDYFGFNGTGFQNFGSGEYYKFVGNVGYEITNNFDVLGEVSYTNVDLDDASFDQTAGFIQFVRSF